MNDEGVLSGSSGTDSDIHEPVFQDWARFVSFQPQLYFRPQSVDELKGFLNGFMQGIFKQKSLRVLGSLHSCSDICVSDAILDVSDLPKTIEFNADHSVVIASANWHLHEFLIALSEHGKALIATGGTDEQTLAGLISTNTAPATPKYGMYEMLDWVEYITMDEACQTLIEKRVSADDSEFPAMISSLGAIGILTRVQFRLIDEPYFETVQKIIRIDEVLADVEKTSRKYDFWRIDWIPNTDEGLLWAATRIPQADAKGDYPVDQSENLLQVLYKVLDKIEAAGPILDNAMRAVYAVLTITYGEVKVSGPLRNMLPVDRRAPLHVAMAEWSFNPADLHRLMDLCKEYFQKNGWPNLPIEIELTKTDHYFMSPWNWSGLDYIIKFNFMYLTDISETASKRAQIFSHLQGLWNHLKQSGIPFKAHWGKVNFMDTAFVQEHFDYEHFQPFIRPLFVNKYLSERLIL